MKWTEFIAVLWKGMFSSRINNEEVNWDFDYYHFLVYLYPKANSD